jgi:hypothetical protein
LLLPPNSTIQGANVDDDHVPITNPLQAHDDVVDRTGTTNSENEDSSQDLHEISSNSEETNQTGRNQLALIPMVILMRPLLHWATDSHHKVRPDPPRATCLP